MSREQKVAIVLRPAQPI